MANSLHEAIARYRMQQVKTLLHSEVPVNCRNRQGDTVLLQALRLDHPVKRRRMFNFLLQSGANPLDVDSQTGRDVLTWACVLSRGQQVKTLLRNAPGSFDFARKDFSGNTALHYAVESRDAEMVKTLAIEMDHYWLSVDLPNENGLTPYLLAQKLGLQAIASILQTYGRASPCQVDPKTFRDGNAWYKYGKKERRKAIHNRIVSEIQRNGGLKFYKLPPISQLRDSQTFMRSDTEIGVWLHFYPKKEVEAPKLVVSAPESESKSSNSDEVSLQTDKPDTSVTTISFNSRNNESSSSQTTSSAVGILPPLLDSFTEQLSSSYRKTVVPPPAPVTKENSLTMTTMTLVIAAMKGKAARSRKKVALQKLSEDLRHQKGKKLGWRDTVSMMSAGGNGSKSTSKLGKMKKHISITLPAIHLQQTVKSREH